LAECGVVVWSDDEGDGGWGVRAPVKEGVFKGNSGGAVGGGDDVARFGDDGNLEADFNEK
jgi:hypothetical protein